MGSLHPQALQLAAQAVQQALAPHRRLRPHAAHLLRDLLALAAGLRAGAMIDYAPIPPQLLAEIAAAVVAALQRGEGCTGEAARGGGASGGGARHGKGQWQGMVVATLDGCCYVVRPCLLPAVPAEGGGELPTPAEACQRQCVPALIAFRRGGGAGGGGVTAAWAGQDEAQPALAQFSALQAVLGECEGLEAPHPVPPAAPAIGAVREGSKHLPCGSPRDAAPTAVHEETLPAAVPVLDLDAQRGLPAMPLLSGLLLGYPAAYVVCDLEEALAASRYLSSSSLCFYTVELLPSQLRGGAGQGAWPAASREELRRPHKQHQQHLGGGEAGVEALLAFSVPVELAGDPGWEARRGTWLARLQARVVAAAGRGFPWDGVALRVVQSPPRPIAL